jgi:hypothetical protein
MSGKLTAVTYSTALKWLPKYFHASHPITTHALKLVISHGTVWKLTVVTYSTDIEMVSHCFHASHPITTSSETHKILSYRLIQSQCPLKLIRYCHIAWRSAWITYEWETYGSDLQHGVEMASQMAYYQITTVTIK